MEQWAFIAWEGGELIYRSAATHMTAAPLALWEKLAAEVARLRAENERLLDDVRRYQFLRAQNPYRGAKLWVTDLSEEALSGTELDWAIDQRLYFTAAGDQPVRPDGRKG